MHCNREYSLVGPFLHAFYLNGIIPREAAALLKYLNNRIEELHNDAIEPGLWCLIDGSYNPPKNGIGYYFQVDGKQGRVNRQLDIDLERHHGQGNDDKATSNCIKMFVECVKGQVFLYLWFCPIHGHCWGFPPHDHTYLGIRLIPLCSWCYRNEYHQALKYPTTPVKGR